MHKKSKSLSGMKPGGMIEAEIDLLLLALRLRPEVSAQSLVKQTFIEIISFPSLSLRGSFSRSNLI